MTRAPRSASIKAIAKQRIEESIWGIPESPEFSAVQQLMNEFQAHESEEGRWLSIYRKIAEESNDPLIRFLLNLIISDEEKHQELIGRMVASLKDDLAWTRPEQVAVDREQLKKRSKDLSNMVEHFLRVERKGIKEYERMNKASQGLRHDLFSLLCKTMIHDSLKHIGILDFLRLKLREKQGSVRRRKK